MNTLIFILLAMLTSSNELEAQLPQTSIIEGDVYIYDYAMKKHNQAHIGFIVINNDLIVQDISFTVNFDFVATVVKRLFFFSAVTQLIKILCKHRAYLSR